MRSTPIALALAASTLVPVAAIGADGPPPIRVSAAGETLTIQSGAYLWKGVTADGLPVGQLTKLPRLVVPRGQKATFRLGYGTQEVTISEVAPGGFKGTTIKRFSGARIAAWTPRLPKGTANVEIFVRTQRGYASYAVQLSQG